MAKSSDDGGWDEGIPSPFGDNAGPDMGAIAAGGLSVVKDQDGSVQGQLDGMPDPAARMKFLGSQMDVLDAKDVPAIGSTGTVLVDYTVIGHSEDLRGDGEVRLTIKAKVGSVKPAP